ncbi:hypothetical protein Pfo_022834 [Paulownia fortunei]|nr:hypothetical protein Pfo_022834 [Paulownia fortunei]
MDPTKNRGRSKLFTCFKPVADGDHEPGCDLASPPSSDDDESGGRRKKRVRRGFSMALKAVFFKTSLLKKFRSENSKQDFHRLSSNLSSKSKKLVKSMKKNLSYKACWDPEEMFQTNSSRSSLLSSNSSRRTASSISSSSASSSCSSNPRSESERIKRSVSLDFRQMSQMSRQKSMNRDCGRKCVHNKPTLEMCIFLVCLVALVFWGKVFAIVTCTSTWFFFAPARRGHQLQRADLSVNDVLDSEEYKKRVIMEGLLERNRSRLVFNEEKLISITEPYDSSIIVRLTLEISGILERYTMNPRKDKWNPVYANPRDPCDEYGQCGPYGICRIDRPIRCECFKGFAPKFQKDWDLQDWSGGCTRITPLNCQSGDGFLEVKRVKYPDMLKFWLNTSMSLRECQAECLRNCRCTAYANPYITNGGGGCLMWFGDLIDIRELPGADIKQNIYIRLPYSELGKSIRNRF